MSDSDKEGFRRLVCGELVVLDKDCLISGGREKDWYGGPPYISTYIGEGAIGVVVCVENVHDRFGSQDLRILINDVEQVFTIYCGREVTPMGVRLPCYVVEFNAQSKDNLPVGMTVQEIPPSSKQMLRAGVHTDVKWWSPMPWNESEGFQSKETINAET